MKKFFRFCVFVAMLCCVGLSGCGNLKESNVTPKVYFEKDFAVVGDILENIGIDISSGDTYGQIGWVDTSTSIKLGKNDYEWKFVPNDNSYKTLTGKVEIAGFKIIDFVKIRPLNIVYTGNDLSSKIIATISQKFDNKLTVAIDEDYSTEIKNGGEYIVPINLTANEFGYIKNGNSYTKNLDIDINITVGENLPEVEKIQDKTFDGASQRPEIVIGNLAENIDYTLTFEYAKDEEYTQLNLNENNFVNAGKYRITIIGKNKFYGVKTIEFEIKQSIANVTNINELISANNSNNYYKINILNNIEINNITINKEIEINKNVKISIFNVNFNKNITNNGEILFFNNFQTINLINNGKIFYCSKNLEDLKFGIENYENIIIQNNINLDKNETIILNKKLNCTIDLNGYELKNINFKICKNETKFKITNTSQKQSKIASKTTMFEIESQDKMTIEISNLKLESESNVVLANKGNGADIQLKNCEIYSGENSTALTLMSNNNYTISGSKIFAGSCITISSGTLKLDNTTLNILTIFEENTTPTTTTGCGIQIINDSNYTISNISITLNKISYESDFFDLIHPINYVETYGTETYTFLTFDLSEYETSGLIFANSSYYLNIVYSA